MALEAYPSVPLFRYPYTKLTEAQIQAKLMPPARVGPGSKGSLETDLAGTTLRIVTDGAGKLQDGAKVALPGETPPQGKGKDADKDHKKPKAD